MEMNDLIARKMENITTIFQNARETASKEKDLNELVKLLETTDHEFISIAFEGASMEIAQQDIAEDVSMQRWLEYLKLAEKHAAQIYVGLGWAIAATKQTDLSFLSKLDPSMIFRMWDGCGYFDGKLRQRQVLKGLARLEYIPLEYLKPYDQGLGRSVWYTCIGDPLKVSEMIKNFPAARQTDLWRGIGIACSYVGGCTEITLKTLMNLAGNDKMQLCVGSAMVAKSRIEAGSDTKNLEIACDLFCNVSAKEAMELTLKADEKAADSFDNWLSLMENEMVSKQ